MVTLVKVIIDILKKIYSKFDSVDTQIDNVHKSVDTVQKLVDTNIESIKENIKLIENFDKENDLDISKLIKRIDKQDREIEQATKILNDYYKSL